MARNGNGAGQRPSPGVSSPDPSPDDPPRLLRGYERLRLLRDLATGAGQSQELASLARQYNISQSELRIFQRDHQEEISELSSALSQGSNIETAGMWITRKENRIAELEHEAEEIRDTLEDYRQDGISWSRAHRDMIRTYLEILRSVADETGAYPQRQSSPRQSGQTVHYVIDTGDESGALQ